MPGPPNSDCQTLRRLVNESPQVVIFTGAGMSTESGIPDFRSPNGIWSKYRPVMFDEFLSSPAARQEYWRQKAEGHVAFQAAVPNRGHTILARWEAEGRIAGIITQNIDGLHQAAGSRRVWELHGTARKVACLSCDFRQDADPFVAQFLATQQVPDCPACGGLLKHATISFGQTLPVDVLDASFRLATAADLFLVLGSSLTVTPAADLPRQARSEGAKLVIVNHQPTPLDGMASLVVSAGIGDVLAAVDTAA